MPKKHFKFQLNEYPFFGASQSYAGRVTLQATDIRTSIICTALGINVMEPEGNFPVKIVSELLKRHPEKNLTLQSLTVR